MGAFFRKIILFAPLSFLFYSLMILVVGEFGNNMWKKNLVNSGLSYNYTINRLEEAENIEDIDILFLGSSHTLRGLDVRIFQTHGLKTFNLGTISQPPTETIKLLHRYIDRMDPDKIIIDTCPDIFMSDGLGSEIDILINSPISLYTILRALDINQLKLYNTLIWRGWQQAFSLESRLPQPNTSRYVPGGYLERVLRFNNDSKDLSSRRWNPKEAQLRALKEIIELCKVKKIELLLVYIPVAPSYYNTQLDLPYFDSLMSSQGTYHNYNNYLDLNDSIQFEDNTHLNQLGVEIFNQALIRDLIDPLN